MIFISNRRKLIIRYIFVFLIIGVIIYTFRDSAVPVLTQLKETSFFVICMICLCSLGYQVVQGWIIAGMAKKYQPGLTIRQGISCAFYSAFYRVATLGGGGEIAAVYYLTRYGVDASAGTGVYMVAYMMQRVGIAVFTTICFFLSYHFMKIHYGAYFSYLVLGYGLTILIMALIIIGSCWKRFHQVVLGIIKKLDKKGKVYLAAEHYFNTLSDYSIQLLHDRKTVAGVLGKEMLKSLCWYSIPFVVVHQQTGLSFIDSLSVTSLSVMLATVLPTPAGIGSTEVTFALLYNGILGTGLAGSTVLLYRFATFMFPFLLGIVVAVFQALKKRS